MKKKISYDETEYPDFFYEEDYIIDELTENGAWIISLEDKNQDNGSFFPKRYRKYGIQLKNFGEKDKEFLPILKKGQIINIKIRTKKE